MGEALEDFIPLAERVGEFIFKLGFVHLYCPLLIYASSLGHFGSPQRVVSWDSGFEAEISWL